MSDENKKPIELDDDALDAVRGGVSDNFMHLMDVGGQQFATREALTTMEGLQKALGHAQGQAETYKELGLITESEYQELMTYFDYKFKTGQTRF